MDPGHSGECLGLPRAAECGSLSHLRAARWTVADLDLDENSVHFESHDFHQRNNIRCGSSDILGLRTAGLHHSTNIQLKIFGLCNLIFEINEIAEEA